MILPSFIILILIDFPQNCNLDVQKLDLIGGFLMINVNMLIVRLVF